MWIRKGVFGLLPRVPGDSKGHVDPNANDNRVYDFPAYRPSRAAGCGGLGSRGELYFQGRLYAI
jgi:hypothetical protein